MRDYERFLESEKFMEQLLRPVYGMYWMKVKREHIFFPILRNAAKAKTHLERDILLSQITDLMKDMAGYESVLQLVNSRKELQPREKIAQEMKDAGAWDDELESFEAPEDIDYRNLTSEIEPKKQES